MSTLNMDLSFLVLATKQTPQWTPASVVFIGAEQYEMISVECEVRIEFVQGGFETKFKEPFAVPSELLLGSSYPRSKVFDIEIRMPGFTMSMAKMHPKKFPRAISEGELVGING